MCIEQNQQFQDQIKGSSDRDLKKEEVEKLRKFLLKERERVEREVELYRLKLTEEAEVEMIQMEHKKLEIMKADQEDRQQRLTHLDEEIRLTKQAAEKQIE
jgi:hypothetical protein